MRIFIIETSWLGLQFQGLKLIVHISATRCDVSNGHQWIFMIPIPPKITYHILRQKCRNLLFFTIIFPLFFCRLILTDRSCHLAAVNESIKTCGWLELTADDKRAFMKQWHCFYRDIDQLWRSILCKDICVIGVPKILISQFIKVYSVANLSTLFGLEAYWYV